MSKWTREAEEFRDRMTKLNKFMMRRRLKRTLQQRIRNVPRACPAPALPRAYLARPKPHFISADATLLVVLLPCLVPGWRV
jgi:hypothetical protein